MAIESTEHLPTIHSNGTSEGDLIDQLTTVMVHLREAIQAMRDASPNGRDYYPQGQDAFGPAVAHHHKLICTLQGVYDDLHERAVAISDGGHRKE